MAIEILMPALSPTMEDGVLAKWFVKEGDQINPGDVIAEIETDKASMEVEAVDEGVIGKILVTGGTEHVKVNSPIAILLEDGEDASNIDNIKPAAKPEAAPAPKQEEQKPAEQAAPAPKPAPAEQPQQSGDRIKASPLAKRLASDAGIELASIEGTGPRGRIVKRDVETAKQKGVAKAPMPAASDGTAQSGEFDLIPLDGMRKAIASRMTAAFRDVPHFPLTIDCQLDTLLATRKGINAEMADVGVKVSVNDFIIRAAALALKAVPEANASYTPEGLKLWKSADVAVAVAVPGGLVTPVVRAAHTKGLANISAEMKDFAVRAKDRKLMPEEYQGGTFTVSNLGMMGIKSFASIINEPQGAIMSVGAGEQRPIVVNGELTVGTMMSVTLTCDHRVVDGAVGARFLAAFKARIENPGLMLL